VDLLSLLLDEGVAPREALSAARATAEQEGRAIASVLVEGGAVPEDVFADVVARALGSVVIDVELGALDTDSVHLVTEELARRYLLIPVARGPGGSSLRVAFANPLDEDAITAVREHTELEVDPLVATVSGVQAAIDREFSGRDTRVIRAPKGRELVPEDTRRMELPTVARDVVAETAHRPSQTSPLHRLEQDATAEQRHEALLLALIEAGALTRSDYLAALKRLMGRRER
jgi:hypothetical protein